MTDTAQIILIATIGTGLILLALGGALWLITKNRQPREVRVSSSTLSRGKQPTVTVEGYDADEVPMLVGLSLSAYMEAEKRVKAKDLDNMTSYTADKDRDVTVRLRKGQTIHMPKPPEPVERINVPLATHIEGGITKPTLVTNPDD